MDTKDIIKSFDAQEELNPKIWKKDGKDYKMDPEVRKNLLEITDLFIDFL